MLSVVSKTQRLSGSHVCILCPTFEWRLETNEKLSNSELISFLFFPSNFSFRRICIAGWETVFPKSRRHSSWRERVHKGQRKVRIRATKSDNLSVQFISPLQFWRAVSPECCSSHQIKTDHCLSEFCRGFVTLSSPVCTSSQSWIGWQRHQLSLSFLGCQTHITLCRYWPICKPSRLVLFKRNQLPRCDKLHQAQQIFRAKFALSFLVSAHVSHSLYWKPRLNLREASLGWPDHCFISPELKDWTSFPSATPVLIHLTHQNEKFTKKAVHFCVFLAFCLHRYIILLQETFTYLRGLKIAWVGDGNNIVHSLMMACPKVGIDLRIATPKGYECADDVVADAAKFAARVCVHLTCSVERSKLTGFCALYFLSTFHSLRADAVLAVRDRTDVHSWSQGSSPGRQCYCYWHLDQYGTGGGKGKALERFHRISSDNQGKV